MDARRYRYIYINEEKHWWYQGRRFLLYRLISKFKKPPSKLLDIGCGGGYTLYLLSRFGKVFGVDISKQSINFCKKRGFKNIRLVNPNKPLPFKKGGFNLITCLDVLEHIEDDRGYLKHLYSMLSKNGSIVIFVPAFPILWGKLDEKSHHKRRYLKKNLEQMVYSAGFKIEKTNYFNSIFFIPILLIRIAQRFPLLNKLSAGIDPKVNSLLVNNILTVLFKLDVLLALHFRLPFGASIFIIAKKIR